MTLVEFKIHIIELGYSICDGVLTPFYRFTEHIHLQITFQELIGLWITH